MPDIKGRAHDWSARPGESFLTAQRRAHWAGRGVLGLILDADATGFPFKQTAVVDNHIPVTVTDIADDVGLGPQVYVLGEEGGWMWVAACRVSLVSHRCTYDG